MPAMSFSEFVTQLKNGTKRQTTRRPRRYPLKVGDILKCYYKQRAKKTCDNCLNYSPMDKSCVDNVGCSFHFNLFGPATITELINADTIRANDSGFTSEYIFDYMTGDDRDKWAVEDGFDSFKRADEWFTEKNGPGWMKKEWEIIKFNPWWVDGNNPQQTLKMVDVTVEGSVP